MMTSTQAPSAAFQACIDELFRQSPLLISRWTSRLGVALHKRSLATLDSAQRHEILAAIALLIKHRSVIEQGFPQRLRKALAEDTPMTPVSGKPVRFGRSLSSVSFDDLELMGDLQVQQAVESARLNQGVRQGCENGLAEFSARLSTAQGFLVVRGDINPLRPEIMALVLNESLQSLAVSTQARACWLVDGALLMGEELQLLYVSLSDFLAGLGVAPALYGVHGLHGTPPARTTGSVNHAMPAAAWDEPETAQTLSAQANDWHPYPRPESEMATADRKPLLTLDHLHHLLMGDYEDLSHEASSFSEFSADEVTHQDFSHTVPAALDALGELEEKGLVSTRTKLARPAPPTLVAKSRARFKTGAKTLGQSLAIEVVGLMIEQIAKDERLLRPVRQIVAHAEPAFLQLAVTDPRFFSEKSHPARRLLEAITSASLGYASESTPGFAEFLQHLQEIAASLTASQTGDADHFATLLHDFEQRQNRNTPENRKAQRLAVQALLQAEKRNAMAVKIASEIRARPDFTDGNRTITDFLTGPWAQVMARERLSEQGVTLGGSLSVFSLALDDLLWSLDAGQVAGQGPRLVGMIPRLLQSLRQGLASIDFPAGQCQPFFDQLMALHHSALGSRIAAPPDPLPSRHGLAQMFVGPDESSAMPLWLAPSEVEHSGFMQGPDEPVCDLLAQSRSGSPDLAARPSSQADGNGSMALNLGDWVDLLVEMQWARAQLTWVSPENSLFMFTSLGGRKHSMTSRVLHHLAKLDLVKVVSQQGVLEGALDSVARTALQNSVLGKAKF